MKRFALIKMPWWQLNWPSAGIGILKKIVSEEVVDTDILYLNILFAKYVDYKSYETISSTLYDVGEYLFGQYLFSENKTKVLDYNCILKLYIKSKPNLLSSLRKIKNKYQKIVDSIPKFIDDCIKKIQWDNYFAIGFSCTVGDQLASLLLSKKIKELYPNIEIIFGGPNVHGEIGEEIIDKFKWVDYVIDGPGEVVLPKLLKSIVKMNDGEFNEEGKVKKKLLKGNEFEIDLNQSPIPDYSDYFKALENLQLDWIKDSVLLPIEGSRGCWWGQKRKCAFCSLNNTDFKTKSSKKMINEFVKQSQKYGIRQFFATDSIMSMDSFDDLLPKLEKLKLHLNIFYEVKANLNKSQLRKLKNAGINCVQPGIENLSTRLLKLMNKGCTAIQNIQFLKFCGELKITVLWNFLYRIPDEKAEDYEKILNIISLINHLQPPGRALEIELQKFTTYFNESNKYGIYNIRPNPIYNFIYPKDLVNLDKISFSYVYDLRNQENLIRFYELLINAIEVWRENYKSKKTICEYFVHDDCIEIIDTRYLNNDKIQKKVYRGIYKDVYIFCEENRSFKSIFNYISNDLKYNCTEKEIKSVLSDFCKEKLIYTENNRYISLAILRDD